MFKGLDSMKILPYVFFLIFTTSAYSITFEEIEPSSPITLVPINVGGITTFVYVESEDLPSGENDDNSILGIDADADGIRDDIERKIAYFSPFDDEYRYFLYYMAYFVRNSLDLPKAPKRHPKHISITANQFKVFEEILKARVCIGERSDKFIADEIFARHLDSESRFEAYMDYASVMANVGIYQSSTDCALKPFSLLSQPNLSGFCYHSCIIERNGYIGRSGSVNATLNIGLGENILINTVFKNQVGSDADIQVRVWQDNGENSNFHQLAPGESFSYQLLHDFNFENKSGFLRYEVKKIDGERAFFKVNYEPALK